MMSALAFAPPGAATRMVADADRPNGRRRTETREHEIRGHAKPVSRDRAVGPGYGRLAVLLRRSSVSARAPGADGGQSGQYRVANRGAAERGPDGFAARRTRCRHAAGRSGCDGAPDG